MIKYLTFTKMYVSAKLNNKMWIMQSKTIKNTIFSTLKNYNFKYNNGMTVNF